MQNFLTILPCLHLLWQFFGLLRYLQHYWLIGIECIRGLFDVLKWLVRAGYMAILRYMSNFSWQLGGTISYHRLSNKITVGGFLANIFSWIFYSLAVSTEYSIRCGRTIQGLHQGPYGLSLVWRLHTTHTNLLLKICSTKEITPAFHPVFKAVEYPPRHKRVSSLSCSISHLTILLAIFLAWLDSLVAYSGI